MFDGAAFGAEMVDVVKAYVEKVTSPLVERIADLELQLAERPTSATLKGLAQDEVRAALTFELCSSASTDLARMVGEEVGKAVAALPVARDGVDVDMDAVERLIAAEVAKQPTPADGTSVTAEDVAPLIATEVQKAVSALPSPKDGVGVAGAILDRGGALILTLTDGSTRDLGTVVGEEGQPGAPGAPASDETIAEAVAAYLVANPPAPGERGERGFSLDDFDTELSADGLSLLLKFARGDTVETHEIPLPQGPAGKDGRGFTVRSTYDEAAQYDAGDIVALNGGTFVALADDPGPCPGPGWQMWARQGKTGKPGDPGQPGKEGKPGPATRLVGGRIDVEAMQLVLVQDDAEAVSIDLFALAEVIKAAQ